MSRLICMWSGPRNLSTAMMRSFGSRADCDVWDEPFFAPFLSVSGKDHPGREETLAAHDRAARIFSLSATLHVSSAPTPRAAPALILTTLAMARSGVYSTG